MHCLWSCQQFRQEKSSGARSGEWSLPSTQAHFVPSAGSVQFACRVASYTSLRLASIFAKLAQTSLRQLWSLSGSAMLIVNPNLLDWYTSDRVGINHRCSTHWTEFSFCIAHQLTINRRHAGNVCVVVCKRDNDSRMMAANDSTWAHIGLHRRRYQTPTPIQALQFKHRRFKHQRFKHRKQPGSATQIARFKNSSTKTTRYKHQQASISTPRHSGEIPQTTAIQARAKPNYMHYWYHGLGLGDVLRVWARA